MSRVEVAARPAAASTTTFPSQSLAEFLRRIAKIDPHPHVLDLGILCGDNLAFLGAMGCRVSVESLPKVTTIPSSLQYPPESFSGILAWDAIARLTPGDATTLVATLRLLLLEGGMMLVYFPPGAETASGGRYRIASADLLSLESAPRTGLTDPASSLTHSTSSLMHPARSQPPHPYQNREIYSLFSRFEVVRLAQLKSGAREVLLARTRRAGRE